MNKGYIKIILPTTIGGFIGWLLQITEIGLGIGFILGLGLYYKVFDDQ